MPFNRDAFVEGGAKGVKEFIGRLDEIEEEVEGQYGPQDALHYTDVEITDSAEEVELEDGQFSDWHKHSNRKNSASGRKAFMWMDFADVNGLEAPDDSTLTPWQQILAAFKGKLVKYRRHAIEFGEGMSPANVFVPVEVVRNLSPKF